MYGKGEGKNKKFKNETSGENTCTKCAVKEKHILMLEVKIISRLTYYKSIPIVCIIL